MVLNPEILSFIQRNSQGDFDPYYVYHTESIREKCRLFLSLDYESKSIHFATMANINPTFLSIIYEEGLSAFVNSHLHLQAVRDAGFDNSNIIFTSSGLTASTMVKLQKEKIHVNLDSPNQLRRWQSMFPEQRVGIRCNIGDKVEPNDNHAGVFIGRNSRLGFIREEIEAIENKDLISGLHLYAGTDIFDIDYFIACYTELMNIALLFPNLEFLNFGGGFGVTENGHKNFDFKRYNEAASGLMRSFSEKTGRKLKIILEPGRIIGASSGHFVCKVTDIKVREGKIFAGLNASTVQFTRPLLYPDKARHPVFIVRKGKLITEGNKCLTSLFGCSTYSRDLFLNDVQLPCLEIDDIVIFGNAGSYCASSYIEFLGFPKPAEIFI